jgi:hypothetical protein
MTHFFPPTNLAAWRDWPSPPPSSWLQLGLWHISPITFELIPWNRKP